MQHKQNRNTVEMIDIQGNKVMAEVGDTVSAYCIISKKVRAYTIQRVKGGMVLSNIKHQPKPIECLFIGKGDLTKKINKDN